VESLREGLQWRIDLGQPAPTWRRNFRFLPHASHVSEGSFSFG